MPIFVGLKGDDNKALKDALIDKIREFNKALSIPATLKEFGIPKAEFDEKITLISQLAVDDACTGSNPRPITPEQMERLFRAIYDGTEVDF